MLMHFFKIFKGQKEKKVKEVSELYHCFSLVICFEFDIDWLKDNFFFFVLPYN